MCLFFVVLICSICFLSCSFFSIFVSARFRFYVVIFSLVFSCFSLVSFFIILHFSFSFN